MPLVFDENNKDKKEMKEDYEEQLESLYAEVGKFTTLLSWIKKVYNLHH